MAQLNAGCNSTFGDVIAVLPTAQRPTGLAVTCNSACARCRGIDAIFAGMESMPPSLRLLWNQSLPVKALWTTTDPPFIMAVAGGRHTRYSQVSANVINDGAHEPLYQEHAAAAGAFSCCAAGGWMLEVGASLGYYSLYAAMKGCRVRAWEPVPAFRAYFELSIALNKLRRVRVHWAAASDNATRRLALRVPMERDWDVSSVNGLNVVPGMPTVEVWADAEAIDVLRFREQPCFLKVDVGGHEPQVLVGARRLFRAFPPRVVMLGYAPGAMERSAAIGSRGALRLYGAYPRMLASLRRYGHRLWHVGAQGRRCSNSSSSSVRRCVASPLRELTSATVDAEQMSADNARYAYEQRNGFAIPWDVHPHSLRAEVLYSTDVIATLQAPPSKKHALGAQLATAGPVGVWQQSSFGLGGAACSDRMDRPPVGASSEKGEALRAARLCEPRGREQAISTAAALAAYQRRYGQQEVHENAKARHQLLFNNLRHIPEQRSVLALRPGSGAHSSGCWWRAGGCFFSLRRQSRGRGRGRGGGGGGRRTKRPELRPELQLTESEMIVAAKHATREMRNTMKAEAKAASEAAGFMSAAVGSVATGKDKGQK